MRILGIILALLLLLGGCSSPKDSGSDGLSYGGYATEMLEYKKADSASFTLGAETKKLSIGQEIGGYKLETLLSRTTDDRFLNIRADFSCDIEMSGTIKYNKSSTYKNMLQFFPENTTVFPKVTGDKEPLVWLIIRNEGDPLTALDIENGQTAERTLSLTVTSFSTSYMQHNTINYITVKIEKQAE